jgi:hypothetical protein
MRETGTGPVTSGPGRLAEDLRALADALEGVEDLAGKAVQLAVPCSSEAELERTADLLGVQVQTQSGARVAQKQFGGVQVVALMASTDAFR